MSNKRIKICFAASSGGHFEQILMLKRLMEEYDSILITEKTAYKAEVKGVRMYYMDQVNRKKCGYIPENIKTVRYNSLRFLYYYASSHFIINNIYPYILLKTKKNQIMIDTWHGGGAYKCAVTEKNLKMDPYYRKNLDGYSRNITLFLSSCKAFTDYFIRQDMHYQGEILESGLIRNDMFFFKSGDDSKHC